MRQPAVILPITLILGLALALGAPLAAAGHWTLHEQGIGRAPQATLEDDGEQVRASGNPVDGYVNRVTPAGQAPGSGSLFLDSQMGWQTASAGVGGGFDVHAGFFLEGAGVDPRLILPPEVVGNLHITAWYGWWNDLDLDGVIDDVHDAAGAGADEFVWRGLGSNTAVDVRAIVLPDPYYAAAAGNASSTRNGERLVDATAFEHPEQSWGGATVQGGVDGGFITTLQSFTVAGARPAPGMTLGVDLSDPAALWDVDTYTAVSPEVEVLFAAVVRGPLRESATLYDRSFDLLGEVFPQDLVDAVFDLDAFAIYDEYWPQVRDARDEAVDRYGRVPDLAPKNAKEPNTVWDDYEGRALFGGVGDRWGSYNSYVPYLDSYHFWFDNEATTRPCAGAYATVPSTNVGGPIRSLCQGTDYEPAAGLNGQELRSGGSYMTFRGTVAVWKDRNADGYVGYMCDPTKGEFDAERNTCKPEYTGRIGGASYDEFTGICQHTTARGGSFTVAPAQGEWPTGTVLVRDHAQTTRVAYDTHWEVLAGTAPVTLDWEAKCDRSEWVYGRDALFFPGGSNSVPLLVQSEAALDSFTDPDSGIEVGPERVLDVDVVPAAM